MINQGYLSGFSDSETRHYDLDKDEIHVASSQNIKMILFLKKHVELQINYRLNI